MSGLIFPRLPHTPWDREWYLPRAAFQARLVPALDDLLDRLQTDPGYRSFLLDGQTVLVADYLSARPEREAELKTLVKTGRIQLGPWYVLTDELIPSGERSEEHTSELQSPCNLVCRLLLEKKKKKEQAR